jgi:hypothetical protein
MKTDMFKIASEVTDEKSFIQFLELLANDREKEIELEKSNPSSPYSSGALGWENILIEQFLERASAWGQATVESTGFYSKPENPWSRAAQIICAGKSYE